MKAIRVLEFGGPLVSDDVPGPAMACDEVLVKIRGTAVNHIDVVKASGTLRQILPIGLPWIPGHECSGVVEQVGSDVADYAAGDAVFGTSEQGAYSEFLAVKPATIVKKPSNLSFEEAASVPVASQTAWEGLFTHGHLEGQTVLIHGGAGAVGAYAVQLASHAGATVIATARVTMRLTSSPSEPARLSTIEKRRSRRILGEKVDVVLDLIGGDTQRRSFLILKEGGHLISATQPVSQEETARYHVSAEMMRLAPSADMLGRIARLLEEGAIRSDVATVYAIRMRRRPGRTSREAARCSWSVPQGGKTQDTWQDRASRVFRHLQGDESADPSLIRGGAVQAKTMSDDLPWWTSVLKTAREG